MSISPASHIRPIRKGQAKRMTASQCPPWTTATLALLTVNCLLADRSALEAIHPGLLQGTKSAVDEKTTRDLIRQLGDDSFEKREAADKKLTAMGDAALALLEKAALESLDPEVQRSAQAIVRAIEQAHFFVVRQFPGHADEPQRKATRVAVTPDGKIAVSAGSAALRSWDLKAGTALAVFGRVAKPSYWAATISPDGQRVLAGGTDKIGRLFDLKTGQQLQQLVGHTHSIWAAAFVAGGKRAVTGSLDQTIRLWDLESGKELLAFEGVGDNPRWFAVSPDGMILAAAHYKQNQGSGTVRLWDLATSKEVRAMPGHTLEVSSVAFSPDGKTLLSSSLDGELRLWDVAFGVGRNRRGLLGDRRSVG
jgi:hypothetical protein